MGGEGVCGRAPHPQVRRYLESWVPVRAQPRDIPGEQSSALSRGNQACSLLWEVKAWQGGQRPERELQV